MTVYDVRDFRNNINRGKNGPKYTRKKRELYMTINKEHTKGTINLFSSAHQLIYYYYKKT